VTSRHVVGDTAVKVPPNCTRRRRCVFHGDYTHTHTHNQQRWTDFPPISGSHILQIERSKVTDSTVSQVCIEHTCIRWQWQTEDQRTGCYSQNLLTVSYTRLITGYTLRLGSFAKFYHTYFCGISHEIFSARLFCTPSLLRRCAQWQLGPSVNKEYLSKIHLYSILGELPVLSNTVLIITVCVKVANSTFLVINKRTKWAELSRYYLCNCFVR